MAETVSGGPLKTVIDGVIYLVMDTGGYMYDDHTAVTRMLYPICGQIPGR